jgi:hypothetical protein
MLVRRKAEILPDGVLLIFECELQKYIFTETELVESEIKQQLWDNGWCTWNNSQTIKMEKRITVEKTPRKIKEATKEVLQFLRDIECLIEKALEESSLKQWLKKEMFFKVDRKGIKRLSEDKALKMAEGYAEASEEEASEEGC